MLFKKGLVGLSAVAFKYSMVLAGTMGTYDLQSTNLHPIVSVQGGYASMKVDNRLQRFSGTDNDIFTYFNSRKSNNKGFIGGYLGTELPLPTFMAYPDLMVQTGIEYNYFSKQDIRGINTVGIEPDTVTRYNYNYQLQTQQVLGLFKLLTTAYTRFYPYAEVGIGAAFARNQRYLANTSETGSINITPTFANRDTTQFSYVLGLGVDAELNHTVRVGLGYRYSNFGSPSFSDGLVTFNDYQASLPFRLHSTHAYANQLLARISYVL